MSKKNNFYISIEKDFEATKKCCADILSLDDSGKKYDFVKFMLEGQGKGVRPTLTLLVANMFGGANSETIYCAAVLELTHNASLIHDDVVDEAYQRRGRYSVNALWRSKRSVLIGDYILAKAIRAAVINKIDYAIDDLARVIEEMSIGELEQIDASLKLDMTEERYYSVIRRKTAYLMGSAARLGARSAGAPVELLSKMERLGELIGMMFQVKDDILDYVGKDTGKQLGNDIKERKVTLPLIYALKKAEKREATKILSVLRKGSANGDYIKEVSTFILNNGGVEAASYRMEQFKSEALDIVNALPASTSRDNMIEFINYIADRKK